MVRCPKPECTERHRVSGDITGMWIERDGMLRAVDFSQLIVADQPGTYN